MILLKSFLPDALMVLGSSAIAFGGWLVYEPAGWILFGCFMLSAGVLLARAGE